MRDQAFKQELLEHCKTIVAARMQDLQTNIDEAQLQANEYGAPKDRYDAFRTQLLRKKDMFSRQLAQLQQEMLLLIKIIPGKKLKQVAFGAYVHTHDQDFFIAIGLGKIAYQGGDLYVISPSVPIYKAMAGLQEGQSFQFNGKSFDILTID